MTGMKASKHERDKGVVDGYLQSKIGQQLTTLVFS
jgi:hypothetical protein